MVGSVAMLLTYSEIINNCTISNFQQSTLVTEFRRILKNQSIFEDMDKCSVACFLTHSVYIKISMYIKTNKKSESNKIIAR